MTLDKAWADAEKRELKKQARTEWHDVEAAHDAIDSPILQGFKTDLAAVLNRWYSSLNFEGEMDD